MATNSNNKCSHFNFQTIITNADSESENVHKSQMLLLAEVTSSNCTHGITGAQAYMYIGQGVENKTMDELIS